MTFPAPRRVAIVHEWFLERAGSEQVVERMLQRFPQAELFALIDRLPAHERGLLRGKRVRTSFLDRMPGLPGALKYAVPLMPLAVEQFDLSGFDLVLSSSHSVAKGVIVGPDTLHLCYCHSPMRYAWDLQPTYLRTEGLERGLKGWAARWMLHRMRAWDHRSAAGVDAFAANSAFVGRRILKAWRRESEVIHPPVAVQPRLSVPRSADRYVTVGRLINYKRVDLLIEAFRRMPQRRLQIVGTGPDAERLQRSAPPNVEFSGFLPVDAMREAVAGARAFLFAAVEDFGIAPVEAMGLGTPVIALREGGAVETVAGPESTHPTGAFFDKQTPEAIVEAIERFERSPRPIRAEDCIARAARYSPEAFDRRFGDWVQRHWTSWQRRLAPAGAHPSEGTVPGDASAGPGQAAADTSGGSAAGTRASGPACNGQAPSVAVAAASVRGGPGASGACLSSHSGHVADDGIRR